MSSLPFSEIVQQTLIIFSRFKKIEAKPWKVDGAMIELTKQVGQLSALIMMQEGYYPKNRDKDDPKYQTSKEKIGDELSDIISMTIRLADEYGINLEHSYLQSLKNADIYLQQKGI
jgi:hypothetical protein